MITQYSLADIEVGNSRFRCCFAAVSLALAITLRLDVHEVPRGLVPMWRSFEMTLVIRFSSFFSFPFSWAFDVPFLFSHARSFHKILGFSYLMRVLLTDCSCLWI